MAGLAAGAFAAGVCAALSSGGSLKERAGGNLRCEVRCFSDPAAAAQACTKYVGDALQRDAGRPRVLFMTGTTPITSGFFGMLERKAKDGSLDTSRIRLVGGDEYAGVGKADEGTVRHIFRVSLPLSLSLSLCLPSTNTL